mgnify:CR=1 FL=1
MGKLQHGPSELIKCIARFVVEADLDEHQQTALQMLRIEPGVVAHDDPFAFQPAHPFGTGRGRQPDLLSQLGKRDPAIGLQDAQNVAIDLVQFTLCLMICTHRRISFVKSVLAENCRQI